MTSYLRNTLTYVWAFLVAVTVASWFIGRGHGVEYHLDAAITIGVLVIAAVKAQLVIRYFMEVRHASAWLKRTAYGWNIVLLCLLLLFYGLSLHA
jgi:caa(3)-type oxidase subunit IV